MNLNFKVQSLKFLIVVLVSFSSAGCIFSQEIKVKATLDSNSILIGEQVKLRLAVSYKADQGAISIQWPSLGDTIIKQIEIVEKSAIDTTIPNKTGTDYELVQTQTLTITSFDSGFFAIPPFRFILNNDSSKQFETEALLLQVNTLPIDTTQAIKDIKPPLEEPFDFRELIPYIKWAIAAIAIIFVLVYAIKQFSKKKKIAPIKIEEKIPPHIIALKQLEQLKNEKLWQEGKIKAYHSRLTEILRIYIEARFKINAQEQTSEEILLHFRTVVIDSISKEKLQQILLLSDLVKFAKAEPIMSENELSLANAFDFVNETKREEKLSVTNKDIEQGV